MSMRRHDVVPPSIACHFDVICPLGWLTRRSVGLYFLIYTVLLVKAMTFKKFDVGIDIKMSFGYMYICITLAVSPLYTVSSK